MNSLSTPPKLLEKDIRDVFGCTSKNILAIPTWQKATCDIRNQNEKVRHELERLYLNCYDFISDVKNKSTGTSHGIKWVDASDPHSGHPLFGDRTNITYNKLEGLTTLLKYPSEKMDCCGMVYHPEYKECGYPVTMFTDMSKNELLNIIEKLINNSIEYILIYK